MLMCTLGRPRPNSSAALTPTEAALTPTEAAPATQTTNNDVHDHRLAPDAQGGDRRVALPARPSALRRPRRRGCRLRHRRRPGRAGPAGVPRRPTQDARRHRLLRRRRRRHVALRDADRRQADRADGPRAHHPGGVAGGQRRQVPARHQAGVRALPARPRGSRQGRAPEGDRRRAARRRRRRRGRPRREGRRVHRRRQAVG